MDNKDSFSFTYSAAQQQEVERIRQKYIPREENKMERLRRLDRQPAKKARIWAITLGTIGALIMGTGMSFVMTELGVLLGALAGYAMVIGIPVGLLGLALVALAYPVYNRVLSKERSRIAPEILRLTDELMK